MKVFQSASADQNNPEQPANAASSLKTHLRTGASASGAFLFVAFVAGVVYAAAPNHDSASVQTNSQAGSASATVSQESGQENQAMNDQQNSTDGSTAPKSDSSAGVSTSVSTVNGKTEVKVNGQTVQPSSDGSVSKTVTTNNGTVNISVTQNNSNSASSNGSSDTSFSSSSSTSTDGYDYDPEFYMNTDY